MGIPSTNRGVLIRSSHFSYTVQLKGVLFRFTRVRRVHSQFQPRFFREFVLVSLFSQRRHGFARLTRVGMARLTTVNRVGGSVHVLLSQFANFTSLVFTFRPRVKGRHPIIRRGSRVLTTTFSNISLLPPRGHLRAFHKREQHSRAVPGSNCVCSSNSSSGISRSFTSNFCF